MIKSNIKIWMFGCIGLLGLNGCNDSFWKGIRKLQLQKTDFLIMQVIWKLYEWFVRKYYFRLYGCAF